MQIALPSSVRRKIGRELSQAGRRETGGLLLAEQLDDEGRFRVVDVTVDPRGGESAYFERRPELHTQALEAFFKKHGLENLTPYIGKGRETFDHFGMSELPTTFLLGRDGSVWGVIAGPAEWDGAAALNLIDYAIGLQPGS